MAYGFIKSPGIINYDTAPITHTHVPETAPVYEGCFAYNPLLKAL